MKSFHINSNDAGQRIDRFVKKAAPSLSATMIQKGIRLKRIKLNGKRTQNNTILTAGDLVEMYINDEFFPDESSREYPFLTAPKDIDIVYEDENILLVNKRQGIVVHEDDSNEIDTVINRIKHYLYAKNEYIPKDETSFTPSLCNRIDRNTAGIIIAAKNASTLRVINFLIRERLIEKYYLCLIHGKITPNKSTIKSFIKKDSSKNIVTVYDKPVKDAKTAITKYKTIKSDEKYSLLEVELLTGRTHQIRAHLAHFGHPLVGDAKYGHARDNKESKMKFQALCSYKLVISAGEKAEHLTYLNDKVFEISNIWFVEKFLKGELL